MIGTSWQFIVNLVAADKEPIKGVLPDEGSTGWSDTWMIASKSKHPNCAYEWLDYIGRPGGQRRGRRNTSARHRRTPRPAT